MKSTHPAMSLIRTKGSLSVTIPNERKLPVENVTKNSAKAVSIYNPLSINLQKESEEKVEEGQEGEDGQEGPKEAGESNQKKLLPWSNATSVR